MLVLGCLKARWWFRRRQSRSIKFGSFAISEKTTGGGIALVATGTATVAANGSMTGTLSGIFQTPSGASCNSTVHQIQMVKR